jgi:hypothetical protein
MPKPTGKDRDSSLEIDKAPGIQIPRIPQRRPRNLGLGTRKSQRVERPAARENLCRPQAAQPLKTPCPTFRHADVHMWPHSTNLLKRGMF